LDFDNFLHHSPFKYCKICDEMHTNQVVDIQKTQIIF
ncbi:unnamed protein product, partial [Rotaria magnacalcarata]